jgi:peptide-methionine (R)-S-oxide reductase
MFGGSSHKPNDSAAPKWGNKDDAKPQSSSSSTEKAKQMFGGSNDNNPKVEKDGATTLQRTTNARQTFGGSSLKTNDYVTKSSDSAPRVVVKKDDDDDVDATKPRSNAPKARQTFGEHAAAAADKSNNTSNDEAPAKKPVARWKRPTRQSSTAEVKKVFGSRFTPKSPSSKNVFAQWKVPSMPTSMPGAPPLASKDGDDPAPASKADDSAATKVEKGPKPTPTPSTDSTAKQSFGTQSQRTVSPLTVETSPLPSKTQYSPKSMKSPTPSSFSPTTTTTPTSNSKRQVRRSSSFSSPGAPRPQPTQKKKSKSFIQKTRPGGEFRVDGNRMTHWDMSNFEKKRDATARVIYEPKEGAATFYKSHLSDEEYVVLRETSIEQPYFRKYCRFFPKKGHFCCKACGNPLYSHAAKFNSETGWPAFGMCVKAALEMASDTALGDDVWEIHCIRCGSHIGNVVDEENSTGTHGVVFRERHRVNGRALKYIEDNLPKRTLTNTLLLYCEEQEEPLQGRFW